MTGVTDKGAGYLAEMLKTNLKLSCLRPLCNNIGNRGIELLVNSIHYGENTRLFIDLQSNKLINNSIVDFLLEIFQQNLSSSRLDIHECNLSEEEKEILRQLQTGDQSLRLTM